MPVYSENKRKYDDKCVNIRRNKKNKKSLLEIYENEKFDKMISLNYYEPSIDHNNKNVDKYEYSYDNRCKDYYKDGNNNKNKNKAFLTKKFHDKEKSEFHKNILFEKILKRLMARNAKMERNPENLNILEYTNIAEYEESESKTENENNYENGSESRNKSEKKNNFLSKNQNFDFIYSDNWKLKLNKELSELNKINKLINIEEHSISIKNIAEIKVKNVSENENEIENENENGSDSDSENKNNNNDNINKSIKNENGNEIKNTKNNFTEQNFMINLSFFYEKIASDAAVILNLKTQENLLQNVPEKFISEKIISEKIILKQKMTEKEGKEGVGMGGGGGKVVKEVVVIDSSEEISLLVSTEKRGIDRGSVMNADNKQQQHPPQQHTHQHIQHPTHCPTQHTQSNPSHTQQQQHTQTNEDRLTHHLSLYGQAVVVRDGGATVRTAVSMDESEIITR